MPASRGSLYLRSVDSIACALLPTNTAVLEWARRQHGCVTRKPHPSHTNCLGPRKPRLQMDVTPSGHFPKKIKTKSINDDTIKDALAVPEGPAQHRIDNDPAAGSPTATLLRLLLPLKAKYWANLTQRATKSSPHLLRPLFSFQSVATTGGVYKWQGHNQGSLMNCLY